MDEGADEVARGGGVDENHVWVSNWSSWVSNPSRVVLVMSTLSQTGMKTFASHEQGLTRWWMMALFVIQGSGFHETVD